ncbi:MAG: hypothetical protein ACK4JX_02570 [Flavobacterium sp.]
MLPVFILTALYKLAKKNYNFKKDNMKKCIIFTFLLLFTSKFYSQVYDNEYMTEENRSKLLNELFKISDLEIDKTKVLIINFYIKPEIEPNGTCIDYYTNDFAYIRFIKKSKNIVQFFIVEKSYNYEGRNVLEDMNGVVKKLLFDKALQCGNYAIIKPNGNLIRKYGEYNQNLIPKLVTK